ncbi:MAG: hypothetical protein ACK4G1_07945, partial [Ignavibacteria bacterium]
FYLNDITRYQTNDKIDVYPLSSFNGDLRIKKLDEETILLETTSRGWLDNIFAKIARVYFRFEVGKRYETKDFTSTILKTTLDGKDVLSVKFTFNLFLSSPKYLFVYHNGKQISKLNPDTLIYNHWYLLRKELQSLY